MCFVQWQCAEHGTPNQTVQRTALRTAADAGRLPEKMSALLKDMVSFFKGHWPHFILAVPGAVAFTALHELAHCVVVWVQGGSVTGSVWLPSGADWGHMRYSFPPDAERTQCRVRWLKRVRRVRILTS